MKTKVEPKQLIQERIIDLFKIKRDIENDPGVDIAECYRWDNSRALLSCNTMILFNRELLERFND